MKVEANAQVSNLPQSRNDARAEALGAKKSLSRKIQYGNSSTHGTSRWGRAILIVSTQKVL
jgi:hypothetical protein